MLFFWIFYSSKNTEKKFITWQSHQQFLLLIVMLFLWIMAGSKCDVIPQSAVQSDPGKCFHSARWWDFWVLCSPCWSPNLHWASQQPVYLGWMPHLQEDPSTWSSHRAGSVEAREIMRERKTHINHWAVWLHANNIVLLEKVLFWG